MEDLVIQNFKFGLDTRRSELTSQPGTLQNLVDAHINQGAEIEKRMGFFKLSDVDLTHAFGPINAGGLTFTGTSADPGLPATVGPAANPTWVRYVQVLDATNGTMNGFYDGCQYQTNDFFLSVFSGTGSKAVPTYKGSFLNQEGGGNGYKTLLNEIQTFVFAAGGTGQMDSNNVTANSVDVYLVPAWDELDVADASTSAAGTVTITGVGAGPLYTKQTVALGGTWASGDTLDLTFTLKNGGVTQGTYHLQYKIPYLAFPARAVCLTLGDRVVVGCGMYLYLSAIGDPTTFNVWWTTSTTSNGSGYIGLSSVNGEDTEITALALYQGKLAVFFRNSIQIWSIPGNLTNAAKTQDLDNVGSLSNLGTIGLGDMDVLFPSITGVRSLRVRDSSLNAFVADLGSPVDSLVQPALLTSLGYNASGVATACGVLEPTQGRYWLYVQTSAAAGDLFYVFSYYPTIKILAWATYSAVYDNDIPFIPYQMVAANGCVFIRGKDSISGLPKIFGYGIVDQGQVGYDAVPTKVELPWLDGKQPSVQKVAQGIDVAAKGAWNVYAGMAPTVGDVSAIVARGPLYTTSGASARAASTFDIGRVPFSETGTHFKLFAQINNVGGPATLSMLVFKYNRAEKR